MSKTYLKIANPGVADPTAFTLLGASTSRSSDNSQTIGKFGSGNKHGVAVCLRNDAGPIVFCGTLGLTFGTSDVQVDTGLRTKTFARVNVKYRGKDRAGVSRSATEDLGFVLEYGATDWAGMDLALREFVSNAIDRAVEEGEVAYAHAWAKRHQIDSQAKANDPTVQANYRDAILKYRKTARDFQNVTIEVVAENQVRAKDGETRVFVPLTPEVAQFYANLGKWFLHFSEPASLTKTILPKGDRNLNGRKAAVIYRRGVRVREFESSDVPSLFDYNLDNLEMDESRKVDDWRVRHAAAQTVRDADQATLAKLILSFGDETKYWEHSFESYGLENTIWGETAETKAAREQRWQAAFNTVLGDTGLLATKDTAEIAVRKGYKPVKVADAYVKAAAKHGVTKTVDQVLSQDDRDGRAVKDADPAAQQAVDWAWDLVGLVDLGQGKVKPAVKVFTQIMQGGGQTLGFYRDNVVYLNSDITGQAGNQSQQLLVTALEEVVHHVTQATDNSRDFQDFCLNLAVKLGRAL
jgi:hypothetical protein